MIMKIESNMGFLLPKYISFSRTQDSWLIDHAREEGGMSQKKSPMVVTGVNVFLDDSKREYIFKQKKLL